MTDIKPTPPPQHTTNEIWAVVHKQGEHISTLRTDVAGLKATMSTGFASLEAQMSEVASFIHRPPEKTDFKGWVAVAIPFAFLIGALLMSVIQPIQHDVRDAHRILEQRADKIVEFQGFMGETSAFDQHVAEHLHDIENELGEINNEVDALQDETAYRNGWANQVEKRLEDVDRFGSRKWVGGKADGGK